MPELLALNESNQRSRPPPNTEYSYAVPNGAMMNLPEAGRVQGKDAVICLQVRSMYSVSGQSIGARKMKSREVTYKSGREVYS